MKKKQKRLSIALLGLIFVLALVNEGANAYFNEGKKTIQIIIKDEKKFFMMIK